MIKSPKGWGLGLQRYRLAESLPWMDSGEPIAVPGSHQDQVVEAPPGLLTSADVPLRGFAGRFNI